EATLDDVTVRLFRGGDTVPYLAAAAVGGGYVFEGLDAGAYFIRIPARTGLNGFAPSGNNIVAGPDDDPDLDNQAVGQLSLLPGGLVRSGLFELGDEGGDPFASPGPLDGQDTIFDPDQDAEVAAGGAHADGRSDLTLGFGFYPTMRIGSTVWLDDGDDG